MNSHIHKGESVQRVSMSIKIKDGQKMRYDLTQLLFQSANTKEFR